MSFSVNDPAVAVKAGDGWILKPVCDAPALEAGANALAVHTGAGWVVAPVGGTLEPGDGALAIAAPGGSRVLVPVACDDSESESESAAPPCEGPDPLCAYCACDAHLASSYTVSVSGFPTVCTMQLFNGVWTVTWTSDCAWVYAIDTYHRVTLTLTAAGLWRVHWTVTTTGGAYGYFNGSGSPECAPTEYTWAHAYCYNPFGCSNLCANVQANGVVTVSA